jgi:hypothetical protein
MYTEPIYAVLGWYVLSLPAPSVHSAFLCAGRATKDTAVGVGNLSAATGIVQVETRKQTASGTHPLESISTSNCIITVS